MAKIQRPGGLSSSESSWIALITRLRGKFLEQIVTASMIKIGFLIRESGLVILEKPAGRVRRRKSDPSEKRFLY